MTKLWKFRDAAKGGSAMSKLTNSRDALARGGNMNRIRKFRDALLGSSAMIVLAASPAFAGDVEDLDAQIDKLQSHLDQLKQQRAEAGVKPAVAPADAVVGGDFPGSFKLPGSDTSVAIHGYTKLDFIVDINQTLGDSFDFTAISPNGSVAQRGGQFRLHARESRLTFETRTPTNYGQLRTFIQSDFFGANGNQFATDSSSMRIRHAYGELGPVLTGQTWTNFMDIDDLPETLDFNGPTGQLFVRQPQIRYTHTFGKFIASASIENPQGDFTTDTGAVPSGVIPKAATDPANNIDRMPDVTARLQYTDAWGHLSFSGVLRRFETDNGGGSDSGLPPSQTASAYGGGGLIGGTLNVGSLLPSVAYISKDQIGFNGFYGSGLGRYAAVGGDLFEGAVVKKFGTTAVTMNTTATWGGFAWYLHNWTDELRTNLVYGIQRNHLSDAVPFTTALTDRTETVHANLIWSPVKSVNIGIEAMWAERDVHRNPFTGLQQSGNDTRVQLSAQYLF